MFEKVLDNLQNEEHIAYKFFTMKKEGEKLVTKNIARYVKEKGIALSVISRNTGIRLRLNL